MDKCLRPQIFETDVNAANSSNKWKHLKRTFESYVGCITDVTNQGKLDLLINLLDTSVYKYVSECSTCGEAITRLN